MQRKIALTRANGISYLKKVDGYRENVDAITGTTVKAVCEFCGGCYHSCIYRYDSETAHPLNCDVTSFDGDVVYHGQVYASY